MSEPEDKNRDLYEAPNSPKAQSGPGVTQVTNPQGHGVPLATSPRYHGGQDLTSLSAIPRAPVTSNLLPITETSTEQGKTSLHSSMSQVDHLKHPHLHNGRAPQQQASSHIFKVLVLSGTTTTFLKEHVVPSLVRVATFHIHHLVFKSSSVVELRKKLAVLILSSHRMHLSLFPVRLLDARHCHGTSIRKAYPH